MTALDRSKTWLWGFVALWLAVPAIGFAQQTVNLVKNGDAETGALDGWTGFNKVVSEGAHGGRHAFHASGSATVQTGFIEIDPAAKYILSGWFKSAGKEPSTVYFGFFCFDAGNRRIESQHVRPVAGTETTLVEACKKEDRVLKIADGSKWEKHANAYVAFNIDDSGAYADLPNWNLSPPNVISVENKGAHWEMTLAKPCGHSYPAGAKVREQDCGGGAMYSVMVGGKVPMQWGQYKATVRGVAKAGAPGGQWWPGTRYVRVLILANYGQTPERAELLVDDLVLEGPAPPPVEEQPVALYTFEEGAGDVLRDRSGKGNHGKIVNAKWVPLGNKWALEFDGVDDFVNCGAVNVTGPQTLAAWIYTEPIYSPWMGLAILGNGGCQIYQRAQEVYTAGWAGHATLPFRKWVHVAQVWDGKYGRLYLDGTLVSFRLATEPTSGGRDFFLANPKTGLDEDPHGYNRTFEGKIASVMLYNRPLTREEILEDLRTSNITNSPMPIPIALPGRGLIKVEVDAARLGQPLKNVTVTVDVLKADAPGGKALVSATAKEFDAVGRAVVDISAPQLSKGEYVVRTTAKDAAGKALGVAGEEALSWAGSAQFPAGPEGARKLNNLVTELLRVAGPDNSGAVRAFVNPRTGFVFISNRGAQEATITAEDGKVLTLALSHDYDEAYETQRYLPKGKYTIATPVAKDLVVRAVAQTYHDFAHTTNHPTYPSSPFARTLPSGQYAGEFEERYVFPHNNTLYVHDFNIEKPFVKEWKSKGRRILAHMGTGFKAKEGQSQVDALCEMLGGGVGFSHPMYDGYIVDEFAASNESHRIWVQALQRLLSEPRFKGRVLHAWTYAYYGLVTYKGGEPGRELVQTLKKFGSPVQWECYLHSPRTELDAWRQVNDKLVGEALAAEQAYPGLTESLIVVPYAYVTAGPPWLTMTLPSYDTRTYLEMQVRTVATHPAFARVRGLGTYRSCYSDEETVRWMARLFRHYAIEGRTEPLGKDPLFLTHIRDGDFEELDRGWWDLKPAEEGSIEFGVVNNFGSCYEGRYTLSGGDTLLITRRSDKAPNVFSQEIKNLEPGRLYSFRMFTADHKDMSRRVEHAIRVEFDNAELIPERSFTHIAEATHRKGNYTNWNVAVFRAKGKTGTLRISDWASDENPGGPIGQELMYNFIKVQPYWSE